MTDNRMHNINLSVPEPEKPKPRYNFPQFTLETRWEGIFFLALVSSGIVWVFRKYISLEFLYLFKDIGSDTINAFYPAIADYSRLIHQGIPKWSFAAGMGSNAFQTINFIFPLTFIIALFPKQVEPYLFFYAELIKLIISGGLIFLWLRNLQVSRYASAIGGICYAFSSYMIIGGTWYVFSSEALIFSLLLFSMEKFISQNKWQFLPLAFIQAAIFLPFLLYHMTIFAVIYSMIRFTDLRLWSVKNVSVYAAKFAGLASLGLGIAVVFFTSNLSVMLGSPRVGGEASYSHILKASRLLFDNSTHNYTAMIRFFGMDLLGTGSNFKGWFDYLEAPMSYIGLIPLLLVPQIFFQVKTRQKIAYALAIFIYLGGYVFPYLRFTYWLFACIYYRNYSLVCSIFLLFFAIKALDIINRKGGLHHLSLIATLIFLLALLFFPASKNVKLNTQLRDLIALMLMAYTALLILINKNYWKGAAQFIFVSMICIELFCNAAISINGRVPMTSDEQKFRIGYNDFTLDAVNFLRAYDKTPFYRIEKDYSSGLSIHRSINDAQVQLYFGTKSYNSFNQEYYIRFLEGVGRIDPKDELQSRWSYGVNDRVILQSLSSVKYLLTKDNTGMYSKLGFSLIDRMHDVWIYRNNYFLPLGFTYSNYISESNYKALNLLQKEKVLLQAFVAGTDEIQYLKSLSEITSADTIIPSLKLEEYRTLTDGLKQDSMTITMFKDSVIKGKITLDATKFLYFSIPWDKGWTAYVNGMPMKPMIATFGMQGLLLSPGSYNIELKYTPPFYFGGSIVAVLCLFTYIGLIIFKFRSGCENPLQPASCTENSLERAVALSGNDAAKIFNEQ